MRFDYSLIYVMPMVHMYLCGFIVSHARHMYSLLNALFTPNLFALSCALL